MRGKTNNATDSDKEYALQRISEAVSSENIVRDCEMSRYTSLKAGGKAYALVTPRDTKELRETLSILAESGIKYMVMGNGTNLLVADDGYSGIIVKLGKVFLAPKISGREFTVHAGVLMPEAARAAMEAGLSGLEFASGIPGSIGGGVFMNAGAYDGEIKNIVSRVRLVSKDGNNEYELSGTDMQFAHRYSVLRETGDIVTDVTFELNEGNRLEIKEKMNELAKLRNEKQPVSMPSAGSFFKRPKGYFAGKLIQDAGLKGLSVGGAAVSALHAGFIVNNGNATASDIIDLMCLVKHTVYDKFGVTLEEEVMIVGD